MTVDAGEERVSGMVSVRDEESDVGEVEEVSSAGMSHWFLELLPQQLILPSLSMPQMWSTPAATPRVCSEKLGGMAIISCSLSPQQCSLFSLGLMKQLNEPPSWRPSGLKSCPLH